MKRTGIFYGVGVGPGDPELITIKALKTLEACPVIAVPRSKDTSSDGQSQALSVVKKIVDTKDKELLELLFPMTKDKAVLNSSRKEAAFMIAERLKEGKDAAFITLGDPMLYSTFSYLLPLVTEALPGVEVRVIPGVVSFTAAASRALVPLAESDEKVIIIPASYSLDEIRESIKSFDTIVLMKVNKAFDSVLDMLFELGLENSAFLASRVGWPGEEIVTDIKKLKGKRLDYFSTLVIRNPRSAV
ncbi:MAG: precorrin-2 C(20)-methyltransferase [Deltaproteobacteria bacterium]|nr:precorrin-2 C(20)-methyltransferase [Deltaproteobacteria bacterium]